MKSTEEIIKEMDKRMEDFANQRVIEELEEVNKFANLSELADYTFYRIKQLKQD